MKASPMDKSRIPPEYIPRYEALPYEQQIRLLASLQGKPMWRLSDEAEALRREIRKE